MTMFAQDRIRITNQTDIPAGGGGGGHMEEGRWVPDTGTGAVTDVLVTSQQADIQDMRAVISRDLSGVPVETADAKAFLTDRSVMHRIRVGQSAVVTWRDGTVQQAEVAGARRLDGVVFLRFVS